MGALGSIVPLILIVVVFYFLLIRPNQKRQQQHKALLSEIEPGDEVVTIGGIFGDVVDIDDDRVLLEVYDGAQIEFLRTAISRKTVEEAKTDEADVEAAPESGPLATSDRDDDLDEISVTDTDTKSKKSKSKIVD